MKLFKRQKDVTVIFFDAHRIKPSVLSDLNIDVKFVPVTYMDYPPYYKIETFKEKR